MFIHEDPPLCPTTQMHLGTVVLLFVLMRRLSRIDQKRTLLQRAMRTRPHDVCCVVVMIAACLGSTSVSASPADEHPAVPITFSTAVYQVVCNDTFAPPSDARCNQSSSACTVNSLPLHMCLNSTSYNVSVKIIDCFPFPTHHYPPSIVVAVFEGTQLCEGVIPDMQHQPVGFCTPAGDNEFVENLCELPPPPQPFPSGSSLSSPMTTDRVLRSDDNGATALHYLLGNDLARRYKVGE
jgi:hypothetical protein